MTLQRILLSVSILLISANLFAQSKSLREDAEYYFDSQDYKKAYELYDKICKQSPKNYDYKFRLALSSLYYPEKKARSIELLNEIKNIDKSPEIDYYLGKAYHVNYQFSDATKFYETFLSTQSKAKSNKLSDDDLKLIENAKLGILNCKNGQELVEKKVVANIKNLGGPVNTNEIEGVPVISADESMMIFTYVGKKSTGGLLDEFLVPDKENGNYHEDIFMSTRSKDTVWSQPQGIASLNTKGNDAAVALSPDGQSLFSFVSDVNNPGDLYYSTLNGQNWAEPKKLNSNINSEYWEGSCSISADGKYLYFASERPGGIGGRDLYVSEKINGTWGPAKNLGPSVNTPYNEDAPFIHIDGITLFFSSEGHKSIGGYDIMYTMKKDNKWIEPINMGIPLNTTEDDRYYVINAKGNVGYFSSNRGDLGGKGSQDIYSVSPGILGAKPILALLKGIVYANDKPTEAKIEVTKKESNERLDPFNANSKTGKYLMAITPGSGYKIKVTAEGVDPLEEDINAEILPFYVELNRDFYLYSADFKNKKQQLTFNFILDSLLNNITNIEEINNDITLNELFDLALNQKKEELKQEPEKQTSEPIKKDAQNKLAKIEKPVIVIENIHYEFNDYKVTDSAKVILDKIVEMMNANKNIKLELGSHTDSRGLDNYNLVLSQKRAKAAVAYIISKGIKKTRLKSVGYGERKILNSCKDGIECSEEGHALNRRTELKFTGL